MIPVLQTINQNLKMSVVTLELISFCVKLKTGVITRWVFFLKKDLQNYKCILWSTVYALRRVCNVYKYLFCIITTRYVLKSDKPFLNVISLFLGVCMNTCTCRKYDIELQPQ